MKNDKQVGVAEKQTKHPVQSNYSNILSFSIWVTFKSKLNSRINHSIIQAETTHYFEIDNSYRLD